MKESRMSDIIGRLDDDLIADAGSGNDVKEKSRKGVKLYARAALVMFLTLAVVGSSGFAYEWFKEPPELDYTFIRYMENFNKRPKIQWISEKRIDEWNKEDDASTYFRNDFEPLEYDPPETVEFDFDGRAYLLEKTKISPEIGVKYQSRETFEADGLEVRLNVWYYGDGSLRSVDICTEDGRLRDYERDDTVQVTNDEQAALILYKEAEKIIPYLSEFEVVEVWQFNDSSNNELIYGTPSPYGVNLRRVIDSVCVEWVGATINEETGSIIAIDYSKQCGQREDYVLPFEVDYFKNQVETYLKYLYADYFWGYDSVDIIYSGLSLQEHVNAEGKYTVVVTNLSIFYSDKKFYNPNELPSGQTHLQLYVKI